MSLILTERFVRAYADLPTNIQKKVDKALRLLETDFRHPSLQSHPIEGSTGIYEARVDLKHRLTYQREGNDLILRTVGGHEETLRNP
ncbi:MAG: hypothetical protein HY257_00195 [Chloroflexi bacterium]|nr:hypothetical protein [Chloroflexota bacterium]